MKLVRVHLIEPNCIKTLVPCGATFFGERQRERERESGRERERKREREREKERKREREREIEREGEREVLVTNMSKK